MSTVVAAMARRRVPRTGSTNARDTIAGAIPPGLPGNFSETDLGEMGGMGHDVGYKSAFRPRRVAIAKHSPSQLSASVVPSKQLGSVQFRCADAFDPNERIAVMTCRVFRQSDCS